MGGGPRVVVSTAAFTPEFGVRFPVSPVWKKQKMFLPHPRVKVSIVGSLRDREVACSASDRQGSNFESCVWRAVSSQSSHHPQEVLLAQFSLYVHKGGLKPDSFFFLPENISCSLLLGLPFGFLALSFKEAKWFFSAYSWRFNIVGSLRDQEVACSACSASYRQGANFEFCVWRAVSSHSSHHQKVPLAQFNLHVHNGGLKPHSLHFILICGTLKELKQKTSWLWCLIVASV